MTLNANTSNAFGSMAYLFLKNNPIGEYSATDSLKEYLFGLN
jgi:hypothetical protein